MAAPSLVTGKHNPPVFWPASETLAKRLKKFASTRLT
jgi:hypothetical protein